MLLSFLCYEFFIFDFRMRSHAFACGRTFPIYSASNRGAATLIHVSDVPVIPVFLIQHSAESALCKSSTDSGDKRGSDPGSSQTNGNPGTDHSGQRKAPDRPCSPRCPRSEWRVLPHCDKTGTKRILIHNASSLPPVLRRAAKKSRQARLPFERSPRRSCRHNCRQASWQSSRLS